MDSNTDNNIAHVEKQLLEEWIKQIEELKNELQIMKEEGQCQIIISNVVSKLTKSKQTAITCLQFRFIHFCTFQRSETMFWIM